MALILFHGDIRSFHQIGYLPPTQHAPVQGGCIPGCRACVDGGMWTGCVWTAVYGKVGVWKGEGVHPPMAPAPAAMATATGGTHSTGMHSCLNNAHRTVYKIYLYK